MFGNILIQTLEQDVGSGGYIAKGSKHCDQMAILIFDICPFTTIKICPIACKMCQSKLKSLTVLIKLSKNCQRLFNFFCQSGENFPNLVTLTSKKHFEITCHRNLPASDGRQGRNIFAKNGVSQRTYLGPKLCSLNALFREQLLHT